jgi:hypothetical protein
MRFADSTLHALAQRKERLLCIMSSSRVCLVGILSCSLASFAVGTASATPSGFRPQIDAASGAARFSASTPASSSRNACGTADAAEPAVPFPASPDSDAFYAQPKPFPKVARGTILASRSATYSPDGITMTNTAYQIKFVSCDIHEQPIAAVATVVEPLVPAAGTGGEPLFVENFAEDALGAQCAPSHSVTGSTADQNADLENGVSFSALTAGWTVVFPDYEGPGSEFGAGHLEGQIVLDSIRAAENFKPLGLTPHTMVGINGYSGGAIATSWAATLQRSYAPDLNIVSVSSGGTPADTLSILDNIDTEPVSNAAFFDLIFMAAVGDNRAYPFMATPILNSAGATAAKAMENGCLGNDSNGSSGPSGTFYDYTTAKNIDTAPGVVKAVKLLDLAQPGEPPVTNVFVYHSVTDELIPIEGADNMVAAWCAAGAKVEYFRDYAGGDHISAEADNAQNVIAYHASVFNGLPLVVPPTTTTCNT